MHDGGDGETAGPGHDANGIHLDLVHDVVGTQGWDLARMTQLPPAEGLSPPPFLLPPQSHILSLFKLMKI